MFQRVARRYNQWLAKYKYPVQILSGGVLWFTGDILSQTIEEVFNLNAKKKPTADESSGPGPLEIPEPNNKFYSEGTSKILEYIDRDRLSKMTLYGLCFSAPIYAFWYSFLDRLALRVIKARPMTSISIGVSTQHPQQGRILHGLRRRLRGSSIGKSINFLSGTWRSKFKQPLHGTKGIYNTLAEQLGFRSAQIVPEKALASTMKQGELAQLAGEKDLMWRMIRFKLFSDIILFDPLYLLFFFAVTSLLEGKNAEEIRDKLRHNFTFTYFIDMAVWLPIQYVNFRYVAVSHQALFVQSCNIFWNAFLSFMLHYQSHGKDKAQTVSEPTP